MEIAFFIFLLFGQMKYADLAYSSNCLTMNMNKSLSQVFISPTEVVPKWMSHSGCLLSIPNSFSPQIKALLCTYSTLEKTRFFDMKFRSYIIMYFQKGKVCQQASSRVTISLGKFWLETSKLIDYKFTLTKSNLASAIQ